MIKVIFILKKGTAQIPLKKSHKLYQAIFILLVEGPTFPFVINFNDEIDSPLIPGILHNLECTRDSLILENRNMSIKEKAGLLPMCNR